MARLWVQEWRQNGTAVFSLHEHQSDIPAFEAEYNRNKIGPTLYRGNGPEHKNFDPMMLRQVQRGKYGVLISWRP